MKIPDTQVSTLEMARSLNLSTEEYQYICRKLERKPNYAELGVFSAMYSEHCSYKSSKKYFKRFPTTGKRVLQGPGENAGVLDIGDGWAVAFKMESHNHPSYIEPYQGAATGVGGIMRDIFTMGARPVANMDALFFGSPDFEKTTSVVRGVVRGVGDYGNCVGIPTVAGQTFFHSCYNQNPLVNAFTAGVLPHDMLHLGYASGIGNQVIYVGSKTGRDGVHGASMASKEFSTDKELERPTVQVGDPFTEKLLLEASLEVMAEKLVVGIQDMGAAGITSSSFEMAGRAKTGLQIDLDKIPTRELGISGYELLLSESQERMLMVAEPAKVKRIVEIYEKWDLHAEVVGEVVEGTHVRMTKNGDLVVDLPVDLVVNPPMAERPAVPASDLKQRWFIDRNRMLSATLQEKFHSLLENFNFASPTPVVQQYDSTVGNRTAGGTYDDAAVVRLRDLPGNKRLYLAADCNPRVCWLSPREGGRRAVAESALNIAVMGGEPIGITDCLNFGNPENPEIMWQFSECVEGIAEACNSLKIPVVSGNVSLYNETDGKPIYPTPMIGMVGLSEDTQLPPPTHLYSTQLELALIGPREGGLGGSMLAASWFKRDCGQPEDTDLTTLDRMLRFCSRLRKKKFKYAVHDISEGGLLLTAMEMGFRSPHDCTGLEVHIPFETDVDRYLFGETVPRVLVAYDPVERTEMENLANQAGVHFTHVGQATDSGKLVVFQGGANVLESNLKELKTRWTDRWNFFFERN